YDPILCRWIESFYKVSAVNSKRVHACKDGGSPEDNSTGVDQFPCDISCIRDCKVIHPDIYTFFHQHFGNSPNHKLCGTPHTHIDNKGFIFCLSCCPLCIGLKYTLRIFLNRSMARGTAFNIKVLYLFKSLCSHFPKRHHYFPVIAFCKRNKVFQVFIVKALGCVSPEEITWEKYPVFRQVCEHGFRPVKPGSFDKAQEIGRAHVLNSSHVKNSYDD